MNESINERIKLVRTCFQTKYQIIYRGNDDIYFKARKGVVGGQIVEDCPNVDNYECWESGTWGSYCHFLYFF